MSSLDWGARDWRWSKSYTSPWSAAHNNSNIPFWLTCPQVVFGTSHQSSPPGCTRIKWICLLIEFHCTESIGHGLQGYQVVLEVGGKNPWTLNMTQANSKLQSVQLESIWCQRVFSPPPCFMSLVVWGNKFPALKCLLTKYCYWNGSVCSAFWSASSSCIDSSWWFDKNNWLQVLSFIFPAGCYSENLGNLNYPVLDPNFPEDCNPLYCAGMPFTCQPQFFWVMKEKSLLDDKEISSGVRKMASLKGLPTLNGLIKLWRSTYRFSNRFKSGPEHPYHLLLMKLATYGLR